MAPTKDMLEAFINKQENAEGIARLEYLRDYGLDKIIGDKITKIKKDFTEDDKAEFVIKINAKIVELGGTV